jgi:hypothetical protein
MASYVQTVLLHSRCHNRNEIWKALHAIETTGLLKGGAASCADIGPIGVDSSTTVHQFRRRHVTRICHLLPGQPGHITKASPTFALHLPIAQLRLSPIAQFGFRISRATAEHRAVPPRSSRGGQLRVEDFEPLSTFRQTPLLDLTCAQTVGAVTPSTFNDFAVWSSVRDLAMRMQ